MLAGLEQPTSGTALVMGRTPDEARRARLVGLVFQRPALLPWRTVRGNIGAPAEIAGTDQPDRVDELIDLVGLRGFEDLWPRELSGGMQSRVGIARALVLRPPVLLLDEPFAALDQITREKMQAELARICAAQGVTAVLVTHSIPEAIFLADRVLVMSARPGRIIADENVSFPRPRTLRVMEDAAFVHLAQKLRGLL
jgi:NitT/TauT family transport system ATP-binding protein